MLAPRASSAFVCRPCELKLARLRLSAPSPRPSRADFSTTARRQHVADELDTPLPGETPAQADVAERPIPDLRISREYMRKGKMIRQRKAKLGMKRMDEDADILLINEAPEREHVEKKQAELEPIAVPDILSSLQQDNAPATPEDVARQLDSLRPARGNPDEPHYVTTADFVKLVAALTRGFTTAQLSRYFSAEKSIKQDNVFKVVKAAVKATKRSEWHPTTTSIETRLPGVETIKVPKQKTKSIRKATLVDKILRDVWKLQLLEELEAPGELELRLKEWELKLLQAGGNDSNLARIAKTRNAKVEIHWPTNVLRVTADKNTAEYTATDVEEAISKARTTSLDLKRWLAQLDKASLPSNNNLAATLPAEYVSSLTGAHIYASDPYTVKIHGLSDASVADAKRTLIRLLPFKESATRTIDTQRLDAAKGESYLLPTFHEDRSLDYSYRNLSLGRWALPVSRSADETVGEEQEPSQDGAEGKSEPESTHGLVNRVVSFMRPPVDGSFTGSESTPRNRQTGYWALEPEYKVSAEFGQALFPLEHSDPNKVVEAASNSLRAPFQPAIPGLGSLLASSEFQNLSRTETPALVYDFIPSPDQKAFDTASGFTEIGPTFPKLHVQVRTGRDGTSPTIHKLSLGFQERVHDVLLPDQATDIRFYRYGRLRFSIKSHHDDAVQEWTDAVRQNIESGGRLSAPSLTLNIPKWTIPGFSTDATGMLPIKYLFAGIQFRQSVTGRLLDTQISYSTVQAGKLGARGGVLSAYCEKRKTNQSEQQDEDGSENDDANETQVRHFATKCLDLVEHISQAAARTQPLRQTRLPRNDHSARKQRRAQLLEALDAPPSLLADGQHVDTSEQFDLDVDTDESTLDPEFPPDTHSDAQADASPPQPQTSEEQSDARLASRLDSPADVPTQSHTALDEAREEAQDVQTTARGRMQEQQADALLDDLFGGEEGEGEGEYVEREKGEGR